MSRAHSHESIWSPLYLRIESNPHADRIYSILVESPQSVVELARLTELDSREIMRALEELRRTNKVVKEDHSMGGGRWYADGIRGAEVEPMPDGVVVNMGCSLNGAVRVI